MKIRCEEIVTLPEDNSPQSTMRGDREVVNVACEITTHDNLCSIRTGHGTFVEKLETVKALYKCIGVCLGRQ